MTLFADKPAVVAALRAQQLTMQGGAYFNHLTISDDYLYTKLIAAEADAARRLRVLLEPTKIFAGPPTADELTAIGTGRWQEESEYDYEPDLWSAEDWGYLVLRQRLVHSVESVEFVYPVPVAGIFTIPPHWIRLDKKTGHIRFVPSGSTMQAGAISAFILSAMAGGRTVPQMIRIRYTAGLKDAMNEWPDLIDVIYKMAAFRLIQDTFAPTSGSISADGLSQSSSVNFSDYADEIDRKLDALRQAIHGLGRMIVL